MRRPGLALFFVGVGCAVAFGCFLAAYDIWGGIPRGWWPLAHALFIAALLFVVTGAFRWIVSFAPGERRRAVFRAVLALAGAAALIGGVLFAYYMMRWESSRRICAPALVAPTRAEREAARKEGLGPLFPVIDPNYACIQLERERIELERSGDCPSFVMDDVPCTCGKERWIGKASPKRCPDAPTSCEMRGDWKAKNDGPSPERGIGCPSEDNSTLNDARRFRKE
jgi:hypothetical protein